MPRYRTLRRTRQRHNHGHRSGGWPPRGRLHPRHHRTHAARPGRNATTRSPKSPSVSGGRESDHPLHSGPWPAGLPKETAMLRALAATLLRQCLTGRAARVRRVPRVHPCPARLDMVRLRSSQHVDDARRFEAGRHRVHPSRRIARHQASVPTGLPASATGAGSRLVHGMTPYRQSSFQMDAPTEGRGSKMADRRRCGASRPRHRRIFFQGEFSHD